MSWIQPQMSWIQPQMHWIQHISISCFARLYVSLEKHTKTPNFRLKSNVAEFNAGIDRVVDTHLPYTLELSSSRGVEDQTGKSYTCLPLQIRRSGSHGYFIIEAHPAFPSLLDQTGSNFNASPWYYIISVALHKMPTHIPPWKRGHACASAYNPWNKQRFKGIHQLTCMSVSTISTNICPKDSKSPTYFVSLCMCTILSQLGATPWQKSLTRNMRSAAFGDNGQTHGDSVELQFLQKWPSPATVNWSLHIQML